MKYRTRIYPWAHNIIKSFTFAALPQQLHKLVVEQLLIAIIAKKERL